MRRDLSYTLHQLVRDDPTVRCN